MFPQIDFRLTQQIPSFSPLSSLFESCSMRMIVMYLESFMCAPAPQNSNTDKNNLDSSITVASALLGLDAAQLCCIVLFLVGAPDNPTLSSSPLEMWHQSPLVSRRTGVTPSCQRIYTHPITPCRQDTCVLVAARLFDMQAIRQGRGGRWCRLPPMNTPSFLFSTRVSLLAGEERVGWGC
jgi:hypothetical protein